MRNDYIVDTNISDPMMTVLMLTKRGYGTMAELLKMDTPEILDAIEFEQMANAIERHETEEARRNG